MHGKMLGSKLGRLSPRNIWLIPVLLIWRCSQELEVFVINCIILMVFC